MSEHIVFAPPRPADPRYAPPVVSQVPDVRSVSDEHLALGLEHAVTPDVMLRHTYTDPDNDGRLTFIWSDGTRQLTQWRASEAEREADPGAGKYKFPFQSGKILNHLRSPEDGQPVLMVEGSFQQLAALSWAPKGFGIVGFAGCANWDLPGLLRCVSGRDVVVFLDADATENPDVWWHGYKRLQAGLKQAGAGVVKFHESAGTGKQGLDDVLALIPESDRHDVIGRMVAAAVSRLTKPRPKAAPTPDPIQQLESVATPENVVALNNTEGAALEWLKSELPKVGSFFVRGGQLVHMVGVGEDGYIAPDLDAYGNERPEWYRIARNGSRQITALTTTSLRARLQELYDFAVWNGSSQTYTAGKFFPKEAADLVLGDAEPLRGMKVLRGITTAPMFLNDGRILQTQGYDAGSGYYYTPDPALVIDPVPDDPTPDHLHVARQLLNTLVCDFPFVTPDDKATYVGYLFLPLLKDLIPPPYKHLGITAPTKGSGKGYLSSAILTIHHGKNGGVVKAGLPEREEEVRKYISTILATTAGETVVFDNVKTEVKGQALESLATSEIWNDRELGANRSIHEMNTAVWIYNGNNLRLSGDMGRRVAVTSIDARMERPQDRTSFRIPGSFPDWVATNRGVLLWSLLTIVRAWDRQGRPTVGAGTSDSFARATSVLRGILGVAQLDGVGLFDSKALQHAGEEDDGLGRFLVAVREWKGDEWWTSAELKTALYSVKSIELADLPDLQSESNPMNVNGRKLTTALKRIERRPVGGLVLHSETDSRRYTRFKVRTA